jgi:hypothetical protein
MNAPPVIVRKGDWSTVVAAIALLTLVAIVPLIFACVLGSHRAATKSDGLWFGIGLFIFVPSAVFGSLLCLPAVLRHPRLWWPYVGLGLGVIGLLLLLPAGKAVLDGLGLL